MEQNLLFCTWLSSSEGSCRGASNIPGLVQEEALAVLSLGVSVTCLQIKQRLSSSQGAKCYGVFLSFSGSPHKIGAQKEGKKVGGREKESLVAPGSGVASREHGGGKRGGRRGKNGRHKDNSWKRREGYMVEGEGKRDGREHA